MLPADSEEFGSLRGDLHVVPAEDGTLLHVEIDEAPGSDALTVVFCHGYALNLDSWHYQRQAFRGRARLVFYDQRQPRSVGSRRVRLPITSTSWVMTSPR